MDFYVNSGNDGRQLLCSLWEGLDDNKKTKIYRQNIRRSHLTLCGASTGKSCTSLIRECLDDLPTDGVIDRCLILVVPYSRFTRDLLQPRDLRKPTITQILLCASILGERGLIFDDDAYNTINAYTDDLTHQAATFYRTSPRFTSYLAKQPPQVIKLCGLMTIIHTITTVLRRINVNLSEETDHGLNLPFYNEVQMIVRQRVPYVITVTQNIVDRVIYLHGFLYEQSERLLHLNTHQNENIPQIKLTGDQLQKHLMREILMMRNLIIMTNAIFSIPGKHNYLEKSIFKILGISHVHRLLVKSALQQLVTEHLLLADYYVLTSTNRPIFCYIKAVSKMNDLVDREILVEKLQQHKISLDEYMILNNRYTLPKGSRLHQSALKILSMPSYVAVCGGPYDQQLNFERPSVVRNSHQNNLYSSNITTTQQHTQHQHSLCLSNTQRLQQTSVLNKRNKRSISAAFVESDDSISNSEDTDRISNHNIERNTIRSTFSITSVSSEEICTPISRTTYNEGCFSTILYANICIY
ncbi:unnamed protein product [Rotaria sp. Silwood2]|nr:unnamed protein product [Rotaria sp. Silwood2]